MAISNAQLTVAYSSTELLFAVETTTTTTTTKKNKNDISKTASQVAFLMR